MSVYTEEEAKTKWCPFGRGMIRATSREETATGFNRGHNAEARMEIPLTYCIGSKCMAWQWFDGIDEEGVVRKYEIKTRTHSKWVSATLGERRGFCGMAGKP